MVAAPAQLPPAPFPPRDRRNQPIPPQPFTPPPLPPAEIAMVFAHKLLDFQHNVRSFMKRHNVDITNPRSVNAFAKALGNDPAKQEIASLVSGSFSHIVSFADKMCTNGSPLKNNSAQQTDPAAFPRLPNAQDPAPPNHPTSYADIARRNANSTPPQPQVRQITRFPPLRTTQTEEERVFDVHTVRLRKRGDQAVRRAGISLLGHEEKAYAIITTPDDQPAFADPGSLRYVWRVANIVDPISVIPSQNPRHTIVCAARSTLSLLQTGYDRFKALNRHQRMPSIRIESRDLLTVTDHPQAIRTMMAALKGEVERLRHPDLHWRPRLHFARHIHETHDALLAKLKTLDPNVAEQPLPQYIPPMLPPRHQPPEFEMEDTDQLPPVTTHAQVQQCVSPHPPLHPSHGA